MIMTRVKAGVSQAAVVNATIPNPSNLIVDAAAYLAQIIVLHDVGGQISFRGINQRVQNVGGPTSRFSRVKPAIHLCRSYLLHAINTKRICFTSSVPHLPVSRFVRNRVPHKMMRTFCKSLQKHPDSQKEVTFLLELFVTVRPTLTV
jgi:hypothetical protein